jgi:hypothetical protein
MKNYYRDCKINIKIRLKNSIRKITDFTDYTEYSVFLPNIRLFVQKLIFKPIIGFNRLFGRIFGKNRIFGENEYSA